MMYVATFLVGMIGVTTALQTTWWNPQSNDIHVSQSKPIGTIDFRYPDWVVSPRPPCTQEGVFPHPGSPDCTWYYRCHARIGVPRFSTFYFECEPGTMFDDDLDQCVHPHSGYNCQGPVTPAPTDDCTTLQSSCSNYETCSSGIKETRRLCKQKQCTISGIRDFCTGEQLWDVTSSRCVTHTPCVFDPPMTECEAVESSCKNVEVCIGSSRSTQHLCKLERCTRAGLDIGIRPMCINTGFLFDTDQNRCVSPPAENTCSSCELINTNCREYDLCNPSGVRHLCDCSSCGHGMLYNPRARVCIAYTAALCPTLECVFRDSVCSCVNGKSLCTGCYMRGNFIPVAQFCKAQANPEFYHVEQDTCLYSNAAYGSNRFATSGHCPRPRDSFLQPSLQCSLRSNIIIRCWSDDI